MAVINTSNQYRYTGRGPFDAKSTVKTLNELYSTATWKASESSNVITAYNGMIVAVWLDGENNGIYYLHDSSVTSILKAPDVTKPENWHKLGEITNISLLEERIAALEELEANRTQNAVQTFAEKSQFPTIGEPGIVYVAIDKSASYIWNEKDYICVGTGTVEISDLDIKIIHGGNAVG